MKIILSRKGFDSCYGKCPSPIMPNKQMISMPIPADGNSGVKYSNLCISGLTYSKLWNMLSGKHNKEEYCHLDPDIREGIRIVPNGWNAAFGQTEKAERHLENQHVSIGDLFLFFGLFQNTEKNKQNEYQFIGEEFHSIFGYLQIGEIVKGTEEIQKKTPWHPHALFNSKNNVVYIASKELIIDGKKTELPGYGTFKYSNSLKLTKDGYSKSKWNLPEYFKEVHISYHKKESFKKNYFQSVSRGQEFVIAEDERITNWAYDIIKNHINR